MSVSVQQVVLRGLVVIACAAGAAAQDSHKDERLGFQLRIPRGWTQIPVRTDEPWIVGKYRSPKAEHALDPTTGNTLEHHPELIIIALLDATALKPVTEEGASEDEDEEQAAFAKTYRDYKEYMRDNYTHGHFIEKEETASHGGLSVTRLEIKAERDLNFAEKRIVTWIYDTEVADVAVQIEVMADSYKKLQSTINDSLKSFKVIPRTEELLVPAPEAGFLSSIELAKLTPAERKQKKIEAQRREWERMIRDLPKGWTASEIDGVYVLNHADDKFAKKVVEQIRAILAWLNETFPEVGPYEYARPPIVRICKDADEESAFRKGSGTYSVAGTHLVTHKGTRAESWEWEYIGSRTLQIWLLERDPKLWAVLPRWLRVGLDELLSSAKLQSGKLVFEMGDLERSVREELPRDEDESMSVRRLLSLSREEFDSFGEQEDWRTWCQAVAMTRYFVGARSKKTRELLASYLSNLRLIQDELESQEGDQEEKVPRNEEEEERFFKQREEWVKAWERKILDQTLERTFSGWSPGDWADLNRDFRRSL